jgi:hypothetical protein
MLLLSMRILLPRYLGGARLSPATLNERTLMSYASVSVTCPFSADSIVTCQASPLTLPRASSAARRMASASGSAPARMGSSNGISNSAIRATAHRGGVGTRDVFIWVLLISQA